MELFLLINLIALLIPVLFSIWKKTFREINWLALIVAILCSGTFFVLRNYYLIHIGVKVYNPEHLIGSYIFGMPIEDILFFVTVPYAFIFIYRWTTKYFKHLEIQQFTYVFSLILTLTSILLSVVYYDHIYTFLTVSVLAIFNGVVYFGYTPKWYSKFLIAFFLVTLHYILIDGIITLSVENKIVFHAEDSVIGLYFFSIPIEDLLGFFLLFLMVTTCYEVFQKKLYAKKAEEVFE